MSVDTNWLMALVGCAIGVAVFYGGQKSAARKDGKWQGELDTTLKYIKKGLEKIEATIEKNTDDNRDSLRRVHERIDGVERRIAGLEDKQQ